MSNLADCRKRLAAMPPENRRIWDLATRAVNEMGFAAQLAAQGAENSQINREEASDKAMRELFDLLTSQEAAGEREAG